jgi:hypothetical protein
VQLVLSQNIQWLYSEFCSVLTVRSNVLQTHTFATLVDKDILSLYVQMLGIINTCLFKFLLRKSWFVSRHALPIFWFRSAYWRRPTFYYIVCISFSDVLRPRSLMKVLRKLLCGFCHCKLGRSHWGRNIGWERLRVWCWGE